MQETDDSIGFTSLQLSKFSPLGCVPWTLGSSCVSGWHCCTAFYHQIKNSVSYQEPPQQPRYQHKPWSTLTDQSCRNVFLQPFSYSFICNNVLGNQVWTIFIARMPARRSSSLCSSALWIAHVWKQREPKALQRQKLLSKNPMHDCSCLSILLATEHRIQEELLSFQTPVGFQHKPISFLVLPA